MSRRLAWIWLAVVLLAGAHLAWRACTGLAFVTDLMALLPMEEQAPVLRRAHETVTRTLSRQVLLLVGHPERATAREAARTIGERLTGSGLLTRDDADLDADRLRRIGALYQPYRAGLLSEGDRELLRDGNGKVIATRALSQVFGFVGLGDARMLRGDPFLLLPSFFTGLPLPLSRLMPDDGMLSVQQDGATWVLISGRLTGEPYALEFQRRLSELLDPLIARLRTEHPGLEVPRLGAVFFARSAAHEAIGETSMIGIASTIGTIAIVLVAFRALAPLWLSLLVIGTGVMTALSGSLFLFGNLHVGALLFGISLIGVAVDYSLQYCTETFTTETSPRRRLRRVLAGITLGTATTVIGYLTLLLAPLPGLRQVAVFSAIGLIAAWLTVVLWLPRLDPSPPARHGQAMLRWAGGLLLLWHARRFATWRIGIIAAAAAIAGIGMARFHVDDDVRRLQSLSPTLLAEQGRLQSLIGSEGGGQFFLVPAGDPEAALQRQEILADRLRGLVAAGALAGFRAPAQYVPSTARQRENQALRERELGEAVRREQFRRLGLTDAGAAPDEATAPLLTIAAAMRPDGESGGPLGFLSWLVLEDGQGDALHVVMLDGIRRLDAVAAAGDGIDGVHFVDTAGSFSTLLGKYRGRALVLLALSAALMVPLLAWRYGVWRMIWIMLPPSLAVALTPGLRALMGGGFSFFDAIALVLILSIGVDYAVFLAETSRERRAVTMLAVFLAAGTALMSFGLLALSQVRAVHHFGTTMLVGILLAMLLAPMARRTPPSRAVSRVPENLGNEPHAP